jgi:type IV pilus assembly PilO-like protein
MNINNRQQLLAILAGAAVALWAGDKLIFSPLTQSWKERAARITELRKSVTQGAQLLEREQSIRRHWESMRTNTLPNQVSVAESQVFKAFDRWSQDSQISITSIKPQEKQNADDYRTIEFRVDAFGSLSTLTRFLYNVEKDPLALKVEAVEISSRDNEGQQLTLGLQVSGLLLNQPEQ